MKKFCIFFSALAFVLFSFSTASAQVRFGGKAGVNLATMTGDVEDAKMLVSFLVGARAEFGLSGNLGLGVGLELSGKGAKSEDSGVTATLNPMYLQIPIQLIYTNNGFFAGVGPYVGFGIAGKAKLEGGGLSVSDNIEFGNDKDLAPLDFGAGLELGYEFGSIRATASYNLGLANVLPSDSRGDLSAKHSVIGIALAYLIGGN